MSTEMMENVSPGFKIIESGTKAASYKIASVLFSIVKVVFFRFLFSVTYFVNEMRPSVARDESVAI